MHDEPAIIRALRIVKSLHGGTSATQFARRMWPSDERWKLRVGDRRRAGLRLAGGGLLGKLQRAGLIDRVYCDNGGLVVGLTKAGHEKLRDLKGIST